MSKIKVQLDEIDSEKTEKSILLAKYEEIKCYSSSLFDNEEWSEFNAFCIGYKLAKESNQTNNSLTQIPLFQYDSAVENHKRTLDLLEIVQNDKKELKLELEAAYKEIDKLKNRR